MTSTRDTLLAAFVARVPDWAQAVPSPLAGDASNRRYLRLTRPDDRTAVLMDAPPAKGEDVRPFLAIARHLDRAGLSAPAILAQDTDLGALILEDLGDDLFARVLARDRSAETEARLYDAATDVLVHLHRSPPPKGLAVYDAPRMADLAALAWDWYAPDTAKAGRAAFMQAFLPVLGRDAGQADVIVLRDYHAENLLWLPARKGVAQVGLLDFQDAMTGPAAYDLVSLLTDARRDVSQGIAARMTDRYIAATGCAPEAFHTSCAVLGVQRNLRILGVFARLCLRDGKAHYIDLIPRVWGHLMAALDHPALQTIAPLVRADLPEPSPAHLSDLKARRSSCRPS